MQTVSFPCPHCSTPLRVRDRTFVGQTIACPDCEERLLVAETQGVVSGRPLESSVSRKDRPGQTAALSPQLVAWVVAGMLTCGFIGYVIQPGESRSDASAEQLSKSQPESRPDEVAPAIPQGEEVPLPMTVAQRLADLYSATEARADTNSFPRGTVASKYPPAQRLSWQAELIARTDVSGPQPHWNLPWNDPANDSFVRRQQPQFLNPQLKSVVGEQRYPATHFIGVAGVGEDAAMLPLDHRRAGIFGHDRSTALNDVNDGLANTMLIGGVQDRLGSWAAGGAATVRSFTAEPYINGPDGFGTGDPDAMTVLMADGSVRTLAAATSPIIVRRMATMNDGLPLDTTVPEIPVTPHESPDVAVQMARAGRQPADAALKDDAETASAGDKPIDAARIMADIADLQTIPIDAQVASPVTYDVAAALQQRIVKFDQRDPVPLRDLLKLLEEMAAVPLHFDQLAEEGVQRLAKPTTLTREDATLGDLLKAALEKSGLTYAGEDRGIVIRIDGAPVIAD